MTAPAADMELSDTRVARGGGGEGIKEGSGVWTNSDGPHHNRTISIKLHPILIQNICTLLRAVPRQPLPLAGAQAVKRQSKHSIETLPSSPRFTGLGACMPKRPMPPSVRPKPTSTAVRHVDAQSTGSLFTRWAHLRGRSKLQAQRACLLRQRRQQQRTPWSPHHEREPRVHPR